MKDRPTLLHPDYLEALKSMPRNQHGHIVDLHYVPRGQLAAYEQAWREWCRTHDRKVWPMWLHKWAEGKKRASRREGDSNATDPG